jgi:hypothetical protein
VKERRSLTVQKPDAWGFSKYLGNECQFEEEKGGGRGKGRR